MAEVTRTNLLELVNSKTEEEVGWYLEDIPVKSFIEDVREIAKQIREEANNRAKLLENIADELEVTLKRERLLKVVISDEIENLILSYISSSTNPVTTLELYSRLLEVGLRVKKIQDIRDFCKKLESENKIVILKRKTKFLYYVKKAIITSPLQKEKEAEEEYG